MPIHATCAARIVRKFEAIRTSAAARRPGRTRFQPTTGHRLGGWANDEANSGAAALAAVIAGARGQLGPTGCRKGSAERSSRVGFGMGLGGRRIEAPVNGRTPPFELVSVDLNLGELQAPACSKAGTFPRACAWAPFGRHSSIAFAEERKWDYLQKEILSVWLTSFGKKQGSQKAETTSFILKPSKS